MLESSHVRYHWKRCSQHGEDEVALVVTVAIFAVLGYSLWCLSQLTSQSAGKAQADNIYLSPSSSIKMRRLDMWLLRGAPKNREVAERILKQRGDKLTPEERAYLLETIKMGLEAERYIKEVEKREKVSRES